MWRKRWRAHATSLPRGSAKMPTCARRCGRLMFDEGMIVSSKSTDAVDEQEKFKMYYEYQRAGEDDPVASHAGDPPRRDGDDPVLPDRAGACAGYWRCFGAHMLRQQGDWTPQLETRDRRLHGSGC